MSLFFFSLFSLSFSSYSNSLTSSFSWSFVTSLCINSVLLVPFPHADPMHTFLGSVPHGPNCGCVDSWVPKWRGAWRRTRPKLPARRLDAQAYGWCVNTCCNDDQTALLYTHHPSAFYLIKWRGQSDFARMTQHSTRWRSHMRCVRDVR